MKVNTNNLSQEEGDMIKNGINALIDVVVKMTGGKPWFGNK